jgi:hypothetical protein
VKRFGLTVGNGGGHRSGWATLDPDGEFASEVRGGEEILLVDVVLGVNTKHMVDEIDEFLDFIWTARQLFGGVLETK